MDSQLSRLGTLTCCRLCWYLATITGVRETRDDPVDGEHLLYSFLTSEPNGVVGPIHLEAMPVILTTFEEYDVWLSAPTEEALKRQGPTPDDMLQIVAKGSKSDKWD